MGMQGLGSALKGPEFAFPFETFFCWQRMTAHDSANFKATLCKWTHFSSLVSCLWFAAFELCTNVIKHAIVDFWQVLVKFAWLLVFCQACSRSAPVMS